MIKECLTHTGRIYYDDERMLEFLSVGDYGKENNIKANFLGLTKEINGVANTETDLSKKWVATISTQHGCPMHCKFCDVPSLGYHGNCTYDELAFQIQHIISNETCRETERFNVHYARMGEPSFNDRVLYFTITMLDQTVRDCGLAAATIHPVVSTMLPAANRSLSIFINNWVTIKNQVRKGEAGLQLSINSTDDKQREDQFAGMSLSLQEISELADKLPMPIGRKYTLNFAVTQATILDANVLNKLFDKDKFIVKLTPIHKTTRAINNGFDVGHTYDDFDVYRSFEQPLLDLGWDVIVFVPSKDEDEDRITCGNALLTQDKRRDKEK